MKSFKTFKKEALRNKKVREAYDALEPEFALIESLIAARIKSGLTQKKLARKVGTKQSAISRLEGGGENLTLGFIKKVARALNSSVRVTITQN